MKFVFIAKRLYDNLKGALKAAEKLEELIKEEGIKDQALALSLSSIRKNIEKDLSPLKNVIEEDKSKIEMLDFLNTALNMEYLDIFNYKKYLDYIENTDLKEKFRIFGEAEAKHCASISKTIRGMGGVAVVAPYHVNEEDQKQEIPLIEILEEYKTREEGAIDLYEKGLAAFNDPEIQWLIGNIKIEEEKHLEEIQYLIDTLKDKEIIIKREKQGWIDPYMGKPGDRPWIEG